MNLPEKKIVAFIHKHHVLTLTTCRKEIPWCANCFYVYLENQNWFVFTSDDDTRHVRDVGENALVAGSVVLETHAIGKIQGIQFQGYMKRPEKGWTSKVKSAYLKKFPVASLMKTSLWIVEVIHIKMTDNRLGFGKKLTWGDPVLPA